MNENPSHVGGFLFIIDRGQLKERFYTLELPWLSNKKRVSCIPKGAYVCKLEYSSKFKMKLYELQDVPDRKEIKFHYGNTVDDITGCILVAQMRLCSVSGSREEDMQLWHSKKALERMHEVLGERETVKLLIT